VSLLQPIFPLKRDSNHGPYLSIEEQDVARSLHQDLLILLRTIPGEWPMRPTLGVGLAKYLFSQPNSQELVSVVGKIKQQVKRYLPAIEITAVDINVDPEMTDINQAHITIQYYIKKLNLEGSMNIFADGWTEALNANLKQLNDRKIQTTINRNY
jgi:phage baseplate assembly protein W|tara:strand:+ start:3223 stop:3687 length:465 start_codon:yes stop_codon:yes gene_type:complete